MRQVRFVFFRGEVEPTLQFYIQIFVSSAQKVFESPEAIGLLTHPAGHLCFVTILILFATL